jgi:hypothetical protein
MSYNVRALVITQVEESRRSDTMLKSAEDPTKSCTNETQNREFDASQIEAVHCPGIISCIQTIENRGIEKSRKERTQCSPRCHNDALHSEIKAR